MKQSFILNLLSNYASFAAIDSANAAAIATSMEETVADIPDDVVEEACRALKRRHNSPFAPSGGQLYAECEKILAKRPKPATVAALPSPEYSEEHRERMKRRFAALVAEIASGQNRDPNYGRLAPGEKPTRPIVKRTVPESWLERWERDNGRPYPDRDRLLAMREGGK